jgi:hypothetical protein
LSELGTRDFSCCFQSINFTSDEVAGVLVEHYLLDSITGENQIGIHIRELDPGNWWCKVGNFVKETVLKCSRYGQHSVGATFFDISSFLLNIVGFFVKRWLVIDRKSDCFRVPEQNTSFPPTGTNGPYPAGPV